jgi:hypothetical protein
MSKYVEVKFSNDVWSDKQIMTYEAFKEELEAEGIIANVASEFIDDEDILEINENIPGVENLIYEIAKKYNLDNFVTIYTTYKYDIIHTVKQYGVPKIHNNSQVISLDCEKEEIPQNIIDSFLEVGIDLDAVNVAGQWGKKMIWTVNNQILTVQWGKEE